MKIAVFPGSFDPFTNGHLDIILRCYETFDQLIVAVVDNPSKQCTFSLFQRKNMIDKIIKNQSLLNKVKVTHFKGLLVDFLKKINSNVIVRGIRALSDFEFEFRVARMNKHLNSSIETLFLLSSSEYEHISSSLIKEVFFLGGNISYYVPTIVLESLKLILKNKNYKKN